MKKLYQKKKKGASRTHTSDACLKYPKVTTNIESKEMQPLLEAKNKCILKLKEQNTVSSGLSCSYFSVLPFRCRFAVL